MVVLVGSLLLGHLPGGRAPDADAGQLPRGDAHRGVRLLLRHGLVAHHRLDWHVVEPDLGHDDRDADSDVHDLRRARLDGRRLRTRSRSASAPSSASRRHKAGATSQDLKTGYIVGATPIYQQIGLIIGVVTSSLVIGLTTLYLHNVMRIGSAGAARTSGDADGDDYQGAAEPRTCHGVSCSSACSSRSRSSSAAFIRSRSPSDPTCRLRRPPRSSPVASCGRSWNAGPASEEESEIGSGTLFSSGLIAGGSLAGILYAVLFGRNVIRDADSVTGIIPFIHEGTSGMIAGALLFVALGAILGRAAQKKLT